MLDLDAIKARLSVITPGAWYQGTYPDGDPIDGPTGEYRLGSNILCEGEEIARADSTHDAALVAHAPTDIAALVAEVERLQRGTSWYAPTLVLGAPTAPIDALIADRSEEDQEAFWDALDVCHDLYREIAYVPIMARDGRLEDVVAVEIADLAARYADELRSARAEWADVAAHAEERGVVLPEARLYLVSMEVSGG